MLTTLVTNSSWMDSSTNSRPAAIQFSPLLKNTAPMPFGHKRQNTVVIWEVKVVIKLHTLRTVIIKQQATQRSQKKHKPLVQLVMVRDCFDIFRNLISPLPFSIHEYFTRDVPIKDDIPIKRVCVIRKFRLLYTFKCNTCMPNFAFRISTSVYINHERL